MNPTSFRNQSIVVTGGSSGIGKALAKAFLTRGARVTIVSNDPDRLEVARAELMAAGDVSAIPCDVSNLAEVREMVCRQLEVTGPPDIVVNNAGFAVYRTFEQSTSEEIGSLIGVNLLGAMYPTREFLPPMIANGGGRVVNISSVAGKLIITPNAVYGAAKHGLVAWSEALSAEVARFGIRVHVVCPGRVDTPFFDHPTFIGRPPSRVTSFTVPIDRVTAATMAAIDADRHLTYVPRTFGVVAWLAGVAPSPSRQFFQRVNRARADALYGGAER